MAADDGYREIQLNGKQLIFLFMATTIVAVVIFLCGVTVGRGVRNASPVAVAAPAAAPPAIDVGGAAGDAQASNRPVAGPPPAAVPPTPAEPEGANASNQAASPEPKAATASAEKAGSSRPAATAADKGAAQKPPVPAPAATPATPAAVPAQSLGEPAGEGYVVQVAALSDRVEAEKQARALLARGYSAFIVAPPAAGGMFRVRVGKFKERRQAEAALRRLAKEEKIKPFIPTR